MLLRLQLISTGQFFVMANDGSLTIEINSTIFNDEADLLGSLSYQGSMPLEDNQALIGNAHFIATSSDLRELDVRAWLGNLPYKVTKYLFTIENETIQYNLLIDKGILAQDMANRFLNQLYIPGSSGLIGSFTPETIGDFMLATATAEPGTYPLVFFPIKNDGAYPEVSSDQEGDYTDINFPISQYMNEWVVNDGVGSFAVDKFTVETGFKYRQTYIPFFQMVYVLKQVLAFYGLKATGTFINDPDIQKIYIYSNVPVDNHIISDYPNYMPAIKVTEFLKNIRNRFAPLIDQDTTRKICFIEKLEYLMDSPEVIDLRGKQILDYRELTATANGYTITQPNDDKDDAFSDIDKNTMPQLVIGDGSNEITLGDVATKMINEDSPTTVSGATWRIPYMKQRVYTYAPYNQLEAMAYADRNNFSLRFLYYHGMKPDAAGFNYPYASTDNINHAGVELTRFTLSLTPSGTSFQSLLQKYTFLKNTKPYELGIRLSKEEFLSLSVHKRVLTWDRNQVTISNIPAAFSADFDSNQTIAAKITLYPVIRPNNVAEIIPVDPTTPPPESDNGVVYVRLQQRNTEFKNFDYPPPGYWVTDCDLYVVFYADAGATTPKAVTGLPIRYNINRSGLNDENNSIATINCDGTEKELQHGATIGTNSGGSYTSYTYKLLPSNYYHILS